MGVSEAKKKIVIENYFKRECTIDTTLREAFTKGFEVGLTKAPIQRESPRLKLARWVHSGGNCLCSRCNTSCMYDIIGDEEIPLETNYCQNCGSYMKGGENEGQTT